MHNLTLRLACLITFFATTFAHADEGTFNSSGTTIRYVTEGEGEPVVLIHGWMADSSMWGADAAGKTKLDATGTPGFQLIAIDCRGHGESDKPHDPAQYGVEMAADVVRLLDHLKIERAHLIGYSSGAFIAGYVAATHPDRVRSVIYAAQAPIIKMPPATQPLETTKPPEETKTDEVRGAAEVEAFAKAVDAGEDLGTYIIAVTPANRPKPTADQAKAIARFMFHGKDVKALAAAGRRFGRLAVTPEQLKACDVPTLFIHGGSESEYVKNCVAAAHEHMTRAEVKVIEGADHMTTLIKPEFAESIMKFLNANTSK